MALRILRVPLVFLVSIPMAFASPTAAEYLWIMIWILGLLSNRFAAEQEGTDPRPEAPAG